MTEKGYDVVGIAELEDTRGWSPIRRQLGVQAFGVNAWTVHDAGGRIIPEHDEVPSGHEELYVVTAGHAAFTIDGEEIDAPTGTIVFVRDPAAKRGAVARESETTVLAVGGAPEQAYRPRSWEANADVPALFDQGAYEEVRRLMTEALGRYDDNASVLYNLACADALLGEQDAALDHLQAALEEHPAFAEHARDDADFASIRDDPRFAELVGSG
jgi:tetratricopeptide (TPR) repeat protein